MFKTGDAEIRALEKSDFDTSKIFPIVELTRGRKSKSDQIGLLSKRIQRLSEIFENQEICLDLTTHDDLSNSQIEELYSFNDGYANWISFIKDIKASYNFSEITPTILVDTGDEHLDENLIRQVKNLSSFCKRVAYRNNITDGGYYDDISAISELINSNEKLEFIFIVDCEYVPSGATYNTVEIADVRIKKVKELIPKSKFIIVSTSFPRYVSDIGNDKADIFPLNELRIFDDVQGIHNDVLYGDYGSINPIRNDTVVMARGWIPRIDVPTLSGIYYHRIRNKIKDYASTYTLVAKSVCADEKFPKNYNDNWGIKQILSSKNGNAPGSAPSYWISVRMSIFIELQLRRLKLSK